MSSTASQNQETQGLLSPWIRNVRLRRVAREIPPGTRVLDLACGAGSLAQHLSAECQYFGVDRIRFTSTAKTNAPSNCRLLEADLADADTPTRIADWMNTPPQCITMLAFLEHLKDPASVVRKYATLLAPGGRILGTTPHPIGRRLHDSLARIYLCSADGAEEHEAFLGRDELTALASAVGAKLTKYDRFLYGLNQFFELTFPK